MEATTVILRSFKPDNNQNVVQDMANTELVPCRDAAPRDRHAGRATGPQGFLSWTARGERRKRKGRLFLLYSNFLIHALLLIHVSLSSQTFSNNFIFKCIWIADFLGLE